MCRAGGGEGIGEANHKAIRGAKGNNQLRVSEEQSGGPDGKGVSGRTVGYRPERKLEAGPCMDFAVS